MNGIIKELTSPTPIDSSMPSSVAPPMEMARAVNDFAQYSTELAAAVSSKIHKAVDRQASHWLQENKKIFDAEYIDKKISRLHGAAGHAPEETVIAVIEGVSNAQKTIDTAMSTLQAVTETARNNVMQQAEIFHERHEVGVSRLKHCNLEAVGGLRKNAESFIKVLREETHTLLGARTAMDNTLNGVSKDLNGLLSQVRKFIPRIQPRPTERTARTENTPTDRPPKPVIARDFYVPKAAAITVPGTDRDSGGAAHAGGNDTSRSRVPSTAARPRR
ncbi:uncharacterized protein YoxC [Streptomyces sp. 3330]|uniref:hypothetical protein n=1 Tax=Streptomyces sp. 3330 TaxID=2817755 RepID=UPI00285549F3|nr:hypothetical protein [Streptomyces sp. 3330]MDR6981316.1 uncharacterized protein YoxC [Streptomyces sp. 3330]